MINISLTWSEHVLFVELKHYHNHTEIGRTISTMLTGFTDPAYWIKRAEKHISYTCM